MTKMETLLTERDALIDQHRAKANTAPAPELHALSLEAEAKNRELEACIAEGANPCPSCGAPARGMFQGFTIDHQPITGFEVGCSNCRGHEAVGLMAADLESRRKLAVENWNAGPVRFDQKPAPAGVTTGTGWYVERELGYDIVKDANGIVCGRVEVAEKGGKPVFEFQSCAVRGFDPTEEDPHPEPRERFSPEALFRFRIKERDDLLAALVKKRKPKHVPEETTSLP